MRRAVSIAALALTLTLAPGRATAGAEAVTLRIATVAPDGTSWARELRSWSRELEAATNGAVRIKVYFGGIAGTEEQVLERIRRDQLDGAVGSEICTRLAPSLKVARVVGVFQSRDENAYVLGRLKPVLDAEFLRAGFINLGEAGLGPELLFTREPVPDMATLRKLRLWVWASDDELPPQTRAMGLTIVQTTLSEAARAYDERKFDGFITIPAAALAFQWTTQARWLTSLRISFRSACLIVAARAFDALPIEVQREMKASAGKLNQHVEAQGRREDEALIGGLLSRQGLTATAPSERLRSEFYEVARTVRPGARVASDKVLQQVMSWLADYRAEHARPR